MERAPSDPSAHHRDVTVASDGRAHLHVAGATAKAPPRRDTGLRWLVVALSLAAVGLYVAAYFQPWWKFTLFAPQYPGGLRLLISLRARGRGREVQPNGIPLVEVGE